MSAAAINWETTTCPLCGAGNDRDFLHATGNDGIEYRLGQCVRCGMVFTNPRPDAASIAQFYPEDYSPYQPPRHRRAGFLRSFRTRLGMRQEKTLADRLPVQWGGLLLDYGCGSGWYAARMRERGWNAMGMDFNVHAAATARKNFGLTVIHGTLPHPTIAPNSVDLLTLRAVLEHVHDPRQLVSSALNALRPGGSLYISVPNLASWGYRNFGKSWSQLDVPRHLLHFTPDTLRRLVEETGFTVEEVTTAGHTKWMKMSVDRAVRLQPQTWVKACRVRLVRSLLTRWTTWKNQGDDLMLLARKPAAAPALSRAA
jgi:SAM-dependent methyltransferase